MHSLYMRTTCCLFYLVLVQLGKATAALQQQQAGEQQALQGSALGGRT
jgi:hypothetical protein